MQTEHQEHIQMLSLLKPLKRCIKGRNAPWHWGTQLQFILVGISHLDVFVDLGLNSYMCAVPEVYLIPQQCGYMKIMLLTLEFIAQ